MSEKTKSVFVCSECGYESLRWYGKCPGCESWNTLTEEIRTPEKEKKIKRETARGSTIQHSVSVNEISFTDNIRFDTGLSELNRVLGGGAVKGSVTLIGGDPGIGKSTLLLQICEFLGNSCKILYISGEESLGQLKLRAHRLGVTSDNLFLLAQTNIEHITDTISKDKPDIVIVDSIQTVYSPEISAIPGSISQIRECSLRLTDLAKSTDLTVFLVGHINKEGAIAGPKVLEHMVDTVLYFEGDKNQSYRILRSSKNRFGSTNEIGVFDMETDGLKEVVNPSLMLLSGRPQNVPGTCVVSVLEGTRPILAEIQALLVQTNYGMPRRTATGIDQNRVSMLLAVLEKRAGLRISTCDVFVNVIGGLRLFEPSSDLAVCLSMASSFFDRPVDDTLVSIGEIGLAGEVRSVSGLESRISEATRLGFKRFIVPKFNKLPPIDGVEIFQVKNIAEAIEIAL
ncbi:MAG: DNA repair protein RadA [Bacillota bacterium]|nr:DNA repair protein RadA [Bacillota bacterium]